MKAYYFRLASTMFLIRILASSPDDAWETLPIVGAWCGATAQNCQLARTAAAN